MRARAVAFWQRWFCGPIGARWGRLGLFGVAVAVAWCVSHFFLHDRYDRWFLWGMAALWTACVAATVYGTARWGARGLGVVGTLAGDALLYALLIGADGVWFRDLVRAFLAAGGLVLAAGLARWGVDLRRGRGREEAA